MSSPLVISMGFTPFVSDVGYLIVPKEASSIKWLITSSDLRKAMTVTRLLSRHTKSTNAFDEDRGTVDGQVASILLGAKPVTVWDIVARLGNDYTEQVLDILNRSAAEGILCRFRVGFNNYYASPKVALTMRKPSLRNVISHSMKDLFLSLQHKVSRKLN